MLCSVVHADGGENDALGEPNEADTVLSEEQRRAVGFSMMDVHVVYDP